MIIKGEVIHGAQLGRKMGFPTANIDARDIKVDNGVYYS
jgi:FAD synthase